MAKSKKNQKKELGVGSIIALVVAALVLVGILAGVVFYVHSGKAGISESAGLITANVTEVSAENAGAAEGDAEEADATDKDSKDKSSLSKEDAVKAEQSASARASKEASTPKDSAKSSGSITFQSKVTASQLGEYYNQDTDAFRKAYDGKTVTVLGIGTCTDTDLVIPSVSPTGDTVTAIGDWAFHYFSSFLTNT